MASKAGHEGPRGSAEVPEGLLLSTDWHRAETSQLLPRGFRAGGWRPLGRPSLLTKAAPSGEGAVNGAVGQQHTEPSQGAGTGSPLIE